MKLNVLSKSDRDLEVEVIGENETLLNPIKQALLADKDVDFAEYIIEHPTLATPKIFLRTKGKVKPEAVLKRTIKSLIAEFDDDEILRLRPQLAPEPRRRREVRCQTKRLLLGRRLGTCMLRLSHRLEWRRRGNG